MTATAPSRSGQAELKSEAAIPAMATAIGTIGHDMDRAPEEEEALRERRLACVRMRDDGKSTPAGDFEGEGTRRRGHAVKSTDSESGVGASLKGCSAHRPRLHQRKRAGNNHPGDS